MICFKSRYKVGLCTRYQSIYHLLDIVVRPSNPSVSTMTTHHLCDYHREYCRAINCMCTGICEESNRHLVIGLENSCFCTTTCLLVINMLFFPKVTKSKLSPSFLFLFHLCRFITLALPLYTICFAPRRWVVECQLVLSSLRLYTSFFCSSKGIYSAALCPKIVHKRAVIDSRRKLDSIQDHLHPWWTFRCGW